MVRLAAMRATRRRPSPAVPQVQQPWPHFAPGRTGSGALVAPCLVRAGTRPTPRSNDAACPPDPLHFPHGPVGAAPHPISVWSRPSTRPPGGSSTPARAGSRSISPRRAPRRTAPRASAVEGAATWTDGSPERTNEAARRTHYSARRHHRRAHRARTTARPAASPPRTDSASWPTRPRAQPTAVGAARGAIPALAVVGVWFSEDAAAAAQTLREHWRPAAPGRSRDDDETRGFHGEERRVLMVRRRPAARPAPAWASNTPATSTPCGTAWRAAGHRVSLTEEAFGRTLHVANPDAADAAGQPPRRDALDFAASRKAPERGSVAG